MIAAWILGCGSNVAVDVKGDGCIFPACAIVPGNRILVGVGEVGLLFLIDMYLTPENKSLWMIFKHAAQMQVLTQILRILIIPRREHCCLKDGGVRVAVCLSGLGSDV